MGLPRHTEPRVKRCTVQELLEQRLIPKAARSGIILYTVSTVKECPYIKKKRRKKSKRRILWSDKEWLWLCHNADLDEGEISHWMTYLISVLNQRLVDQTLPPPSEPTKPLKLTKSRLNNLVLKHFKNSYVKNAILEAPTAFND
jgi:hypothetical protein